MPHMCFLPRNWQTPLHHLLQDQAPLSQCSESGIPEKVKELLGLILPLQGCQVGNNRRMWYQVGEKPFCPLPTEVGSQVLFG